MNTQNLEKQVKFCYLVMGWPIGKSHCDRECLFLPTPSKSQLTTAKIPIEVIGCKCILAMGLLEPSDLNMKIHVLLIRISKVSLVQILVSVSDRVISDAAHTQMSISSLLFPVTIYQWPEMKHMRLVMHCKCLQGVSEIYTLQRKYIIYRGNIC